jgi:hypothetical protein
MATTVEAVMVFLGLTPSRTVDNDALNAAVVAANDLVATLRPDLTGDAWPPRADQAATIHAARLYGRRGSVNGVAAFQDVGVTLVPRLDPDVRSLLELGEYQRSVIA